MTPLRRLTTSLLTAAVVLAGLVAVGPAANASDASSFESLTNAARASAGLAPYAVSADLSAVALAQARRMAAAQKLYHNPGLASAVTNWAYVGENVGYGPSVAALQSAFMHSAPHRANILDHDFTQVGVGSVTVNGTIWVSVVFRRPLHVSSHPTVSPRAHIPPARSGLSRTATAPRPSAPPVRTLPAGVRCSVDAVAEQQIRGLALADHTVRLVQQSQRLVLGYQCGRGLPMTGLLDPATTFALMR